MNAAEIVVRKVQGDGGFQVRQLFAERIGKPSKAAKLHPHGQVLPFHKASRDVIFVGPSVDDLGYDLRDPWWGVPRVGAIVLSVIPEQFHKLREVGLSTENALNRAVGRVSHGRKRNLKATIQISNTVIKTPPNCLKFRQNPARRNMGRKDFVSTLPPHCETSVNAHCGNR
jgi:hypothetical protein